MPNKGTLTQEETDTRFIYVALFRNYMLKIEWSPKRFYKFEPLLEIGHVVISGDYIQLSHAGLKHWKKFILANYPKGQKMGADLKRIFESD